MKKLYKLLLICLLTIAGGSNALNAKSYNNGDTKNNLATTNTNSTVTYTITVNASPSSYGTVSGGGEYEEGSIVTLTAEPKSGREFVEWQKDGVQVSTDTEYTFTVTESCTLTAKFKYKEYSITYYANDGSEQTYVDHKSHGSNYNIINHTTCGFTPPEGMAFIAWARNSVDGYQMAPGQSISNNSDCSFYAIWDTPVVSVIIGNDTTQYGSLVDAFNYANGKTATITMLKDWDNSVLSDHPKFTSNNTIVTLDLNGKRIYNDSYPSESNALEFSGDCIIKNGEIEFTGGGQYIKFYSTSSQKKLTIQGDVKITNKNSYGRCISLGNNNTVIIENGAEISSPNNDDTNEAAIFFYGNGTLIINGGTISSKKNCIFSNNNAPNSIVVVNAGNFNNVKAGDVYFNVEHNTTVIGNAWYKLTNNIPSTTATIEYTSNTTKYNETTYGLADNIVSVTATPTNNDIKISKLLANDIEANLTNDIYSFTMPKTIVTLSAETIDLIGNNKCGDNLFWAVDEENTLTIFGTGAMYDYEFSGNKAPWRNLNPAPTSLVLEEGITSIGNYAFALCSGFTGSLTIPNSVTTIGDYAFSDCSNFVCVYALASTAPELGDKTFNGINNTILIYDENNAISYESNGWFGYFSKKLKKDNENFLYIESTEDFMDYARISKETSNKFSVRLYADINLIGFEWTPFTMERDMVFDGNGHNIHIEQDWSGTESGSNFGLFHTYNYNVIKNLTMTGYVKANTSGNVGAITGSAYRTTISNVISYVEVSNIGSGRAGGLAGQFGGQHSGELYSLIENCAVYANVTGNVAGGIIGHGWSGYQYYDIKNVAYVGDVTGSERQAAVIAYHGNNSSATKCKFENIYYCEKDALGFVGGGNTNYDLGTDVAAKTTAQFASGEVAYLLQGEQTTQVWGQNIDNGETAQQYSVFSNAKVYKHTFNGVTLYSNHEKLAAGGKCGDNLFWNVNNNNTLTIYGTGAMYDYEYNEYNEYNGGDISPWRSLNSAPKSLVLEEGITYIGDYAFYKCSSFKGSLTIPNSVTNIGDRAFYNCSGFNGYLTIGNSVTTIGNAAFYGCDGFKGSLTIPNSVTSIGTSAFHLCSGFTGSLTIGNSVTTIGSSAFYGCDGFKGSLTIPNSVTSIGNHAFSNCSGFTGDLTIPNSVTSIEELAFYGCSGFTGSLTIPNSVTSIGNEAFHNCSGFNGYLTIGNSVTTIGNYAFQNCSGLTGSLTIGNSVTTIGKYAFYNCYGFTGALTIPNSVTTIGDYAFRYCSGLTNIFFYRDTNPTIGSYAFNDLKSSAKIYVPVIWSSYTGIPSSKLVKMATYVGQQSTDNGQQSSSTAWVGLAEGQTEPGENDHVAINAPLVLGQQTTDNGQQTSMDDNRQLTTDNSLWVKSFGYCGNGTTVNGSITIEDGGQLYCEVARGEVTVKKEIIGYAGQQSTDNSQQTVWYTIASPLKDTLLISDPQFLRSSVPQFLSSNSDLYRYDEPTYTWQNAKPGEGSTNFQTIDPGRGYLYANAENTTLEFTGMINTDEVTYNLTTDGDVLTGFHLVGNPFTHNITFAHLNATEGAELVNGYYVLNGEGAWGATLGSNEDDVIKVGQGALIKAKTAGTLAISREPRAMSNEQRRNGSQLTAHSSMLITVSNAKHSDKAFIVFDKGVGLDKINHENENIPLLYIPMDDADYAIAMMDINVNEIPVNFETNVMGQYTISLRQDNCEFDELYLLDKQTGEKVNILENDYTFIATSNDAPERFVLLKDNGQQTTDNSHFAYINNGDIVVYDIEGKAQISIFDAMGRCLYKGNSSDETARIANDFSAGVYVIQKADDNGVNVQKIILE